MRWLGAAAVLCAVALPADGQSQAQIDAAYQNALVGAIYLRDNSRDPPRFVLEDVRIMDGSLAACYRFRASNGFGGMTRAQAVFSADGQYLRVTGNTGFPELYALLCADKPGQSATAAINRLLK